MERKKGLDILGIEPISKAVDTTVTKTFEGVEGFLKLVCVPAMEEFGLMVKDQIRHWRLNNIMKVMEKAEGKLDFDGQNLRIKAHPRVALSILENGSLSDNDEVQEMWAGLFASSCTKDGQDDENLIFVDLLKQLTFIEAKILKHCCEIAPKVAHDTGLFTSFELLLSADDLFELTGIKDIQRLDRELDHLKSLQLIGHSWGGGFNSDDMNLIADVTPTALALNLYIRSQGFIGHPKEYWKDRVYTYAEAVERNNMERIERSKRESDMASIVEDANLNSQDLSRGK